MDLMMAMFAISYSLWICVVLPTPPMQVHQLTPPIENVNIVCPRLIVWMTVRQVSAFLYLLLISVHINAYPLLIQISSAESPTTDHPSTGSSSFTSNT